MKDGRPSVRAPRRVRRPVGVMDDLTQQLERFLPLLSFQVTYGFHDSYRRIGDFLGMDSTISSFMTIENMELAIKVFICISVKENSVPLKNC